MIALLKPIAYLIHRMATPFGRVWAHASLSAQINGTIESSAIFLSTPEVQGTKQITLGKDLLLYRDIYLETQDKGTIIVEDDCVMSRGVHIVSHAKVQIGKGTMIGEYASIRDANHRIIDGVTIRSSGYDARPILIGSNVWIGKGAIVLPGVTIGDRSVIGANAVVTGDVPEGSVYVGVPAKPLKTKS